MLLLLDFDKIKNKNKQIKKELHDNSKLVSKNRQPLRCGFEVLTFGRYNEIYCRPHQH